MAERRPERRLAAILAADVVGYSRLMGKDEITLRIAAIIEPAIEHSEEKRLAAKAPKDLGAWDLCIQGFSQVYLGTKEANATARAKRLGSALTTLNLTSCWQRPLDISIELTKPSRQSANFATKPGTIRKIINSGQRDQAAISRRSQAGRFARLGSLFSPKL